MRTNKKKMRYAREFIIVLLIFAIAALGHALSENKVKNNNLEEQIRKKEAAIDSVTELKNTATLEYLRAVREKDIAIRDLKYESHRTEAVTRKYEAFRRIATPRLSDAQIDSAANALYPGR